MMERTRKTRKVSMTMAVAEAEAGTAETEREQIMALAKESEEAVVVVEVAAVEEAKEAISATTMQEEVEEILQGLDVTCYINDLGIWTKNSFQNTKS